MLDLLWVAQQVSYLIDLFAQTAQEADAPTPVGVRAVEPDACLVAETL
jgi:hypothetical protein